MGSCFSDEIGSRLLSNKFNALSNPFGTIYNPLSFFKALKGELDPKNIVEVDGVYRHWDCHGEIAGLSEDELEKLLSDRLQQSKDQLSKAKWLVITFGTAFAYRLKSTSELVANCHKVPQSQFTKELLSTKVITKEFERLYAFLKGTNPSLQILLTVSPVRHVRDGLSENNLSKAILIQSAHELAEEHKDVQYFPSYEILIDELRDYRFYKLDRVHPTDEAVDYIWRTFAGTYFDTEALDFLKQWEKIRSAINHRPFHPASEKHQQFLKATLKQLDALNELVDVRVEREILEQQLT